MVTTQEYQHSGSVDISGMLAITTGSCNKLYPLQDFFQRTIQLKTCLRILDLLIFAIRMFTLPCILVVITLSITDITITKNRKKRV